MFVQIHSYYCDNHPAFDQNRLFICCMRMYTVHVSTQVTGTCRCTCTCSLPVWSWRLDSLLGACCVCNNPLYIKTVYKSHPKGREHPGIHYEWPMEQLATLFNCDYSCAIHQFTHTCNSFSVVAIKVIPDNLKSLGSWDALGVT